MLKLEEYIAKRKTEDKLNEFDLSTKEENLKICVNYMFEYYHNYLNSDILHEKTVLNSERLGKFRKQFEDYEIDVQDWLVHIYDVYEKHIHRSINSLLKKEQLFYLYHTDSEFRSSSYDCYAQLIKKNGYLRDQTDNLFKYIKDYHRVQSLKRMEWQDPFISEDISSWIEDTWVKYKVSIWAFVEDYTNRFYDDESLWPVKHRIKEKGQIGTSYNYKLKTNLFNLNMLYPKISNKPFIKGKKQYLEILMMHNWLHSIENDPDNYWEEYINKTIKL